jgi:hypothetical protein
LWAALGVAAPAGQNFFDRLQVPGVNELQQAHFQPEARLRGVLQLAIKLEQQLQVAR